MDSILTQTFEDWELIVCDSFSEDGTWEYFEQFRADPRIRLHRVPREGLYAGWNECLKRVTGEYIYVATADDTCAPECLEKMVGALEGIRREERGNGRKDGSPAEGGAPSFSLSTMPVTVDPSIRAAQQRSCQNRDCRHVDIAVCNFQTIDESGREIDHPAGRWPRKYYGEWMERPHIRDGRTEFLLHSCLGVIWWTMTAVLFRKTLLDRIGVFRRDRGSRADEEWEMRAALASDIIYVPMKLATWRVHPAQASARFPARDRTNLNSIEAVLDDDMSNVPCEWKNINNWRAEITNIYRTHYLDSFELYGGTALKSPMRFIVSAVSALVREPGFLLRQILRRFAWDPGLSPDPVVAAHRLIELFKSPWPPRSSLNR